MAEVLEGVLLTVHIAMRHAPGQDCTDRKEMALVALKRALRDYDIDGIEILQVVQINEGYRRKPRE